MHTAVYCAVFWGIDFYVMHFHFVSLSLSMSPSTSLYSSIQSATTPCQNDGKGCSWVQFGANIDGEASGDSSGYSISLFSKWSTTGFRNIE